MLLIQALLVQKQQQLLLLQVFLLQLQSQVVVVGFPLLLYLPLVPCLLLLLLCRLQLRC